MDAETKAMAESNNRAFAAGWDVGAGQDLTLGGVSLATVMEYDLLRVLGSVWLAAPAAEAEHA